MKARSLVGFLMLTVLPLAAIGQATMTKTTEKNGKRKKKTVTVPDWGAAQNYIGDRCAYFPDYYTFYDPNRGYVYWNNGAWITTSTLPDYMSGVDMSRARMQILQDVSVRPEMRYGAYSQTYPAQRVEVTVPVPGAR